ncbi:hypothetical protein [Sphingomonas adhaesiva]|uniref:hypothetical protein n=1 Tax=Sphingomonas adhaesiva TaxID=28212 RepID=UPI002FFB9A5C
MADDATLAEMVRQLAAMPEGDRAVVLAALDDAEATEVGRLVRALTAGELSQPLRAVLAEGGEGVTPRAAAAIRAAALSQTAVVPDPAPPGMSLWQRLTGAVWGRA